MEKDTQKEEYLHSTLARSYLSYFIFSFIGLFIDSFIKLDYHIKHGDTLTLVCFVVGSFFIFWAQYTSRHLAKGIGTAPSPYFHSGPYRLMRNPTHLGIVMLVAGYTIVSGSIIFLFITMMGYLVSNVFFRKYESILRDTYGDDYQQYKSKVPKIL